MDINRTSASCDFTNALVLLYKWLRQESPAPGRRAGAGPGTARRMPRPDSQEPVERFFWQAGPLLAYARG
jgi:hypothetical protein